MILRRLGRADAEIYRGIRLEALRSAPDAYGSTYQDWADAPLPVFADRTDASVVLGAFDTGALVGLSAMERDKGGNTRHRALVTAVFVRPAARGRGLAVTMIDELARIAVADGILQLELNVVTTNAVAIRAYERAGFRHVGRYPRALLSGGVFHDETVMIRMLDGRPPGHGGRARA